LAIRLGGIFGFDQTIGLVIIIKSLVVNVGGDIGDYFVSSSRS